MKPKAEWAIDSEAMRARGIIVSAAIVLALNQSERGIDKRPLVGFY